VLDLPRADPRSVLTAARWASKSARETHGDHTRPALSADHAGLNRTGVQHSFTTMTMDKAPRRGG
jgi:hypothetical protein